jgi:hypothetical protein
MRNVHLILVLAAGLLPLATARAAPADVPETGQATCFDAAGTVVACAGTGQDGEHRAGVAWPNPRFVAGTGPTAACVTDNLTGLMWTRNANLPAGTRTWQQALDFANGLDLCGFTDWRLPNVNELESLLNSEVAVQATFLNTQGFTNVQASLYWSSTTSVYLNTHAAWFVDMNDGGVSDVDESFPSFVWPVRAGP